MKNLLHDIMVFPEVTGAVVCDRTQGLLTDIDLPTSINGKQLAGSCPSLLRLFAARDTITSMEFHFADNLLLVSPVAKDVILLTFCVPEANVALLNMTITMLLPNLQVAAAAMVKPPAPKAGTAAAPPPAKPAKQTTPAPVKPVKPTTPAPAKAAAPAPAAPAQAPKTTASPITATKPVDADALLSTGPLAHTLTEFQTGVAYAIGPVGEMVMRDALVEWGKNGECSAKRLPELVNILCREIADPELEQEFQEKVKTFL